tara:strand:- start:40986 stop:41411 length:426 start_codon:yes stop_codon:yes gene_type:complete
MYYYTNADGSRTPFAESGLRKVVETLVDNKTLLAEDSGKEFEIGTDAKVITLPATKKGLVYRVRNIGADGNNTVTLSPVAADKIIGSISNAAADSVSAGANDKDIINTKATANRGDWIELTGDGVDGWYISGGVGIWASEA